jgi:hypothetical protein
MPEPASPSFRSCFARGPPAARSSGSTGTWPRDDAKDSARAFEKLAVKRDGSARIRADAPLIVPIDDLLDDVQTQRLKRAAQNLVDS